MERDAELYCGISLPTGSNENTKKETSSCKPNYFKYSFTYLNVLE